MWIATLFTKTTKRAILLEANGRASAAKQSRAINVGYFLSYIKLKKKNLEIFSNEIGTNFGISCKGSWEIERVQQDATKLYKTKKNLHVTFI